MATINPNDFSFYILADGTLVCSAANLKGQVTFDNGVKFKNYTLGNVIEVIGNLSKPIIEYSYSLHGESSHELETDSMIFEMYRLIDSSLCVGIQRERSGSQSGSQSVALDRGDSEFTVYRDRTITIALQFFEPLGDLVKIGLKMKKTASGNSNFSYNIKDYVGQLYGAGTGSVSQYDSVIELPLDTTYTIFGSNEKTPDAILVSITPDAVCSLSAEIILYIRENN